MDVDEIRDLNDEQIERRIGELREELFRLRFQSATMTLENPKILQRIKRDVARMKTILREREMAAEAAGSEPAAVAAEAES